MGAVDFAPDSTPRGWQPPWQVALAFAYHTVLESMASSQGVWPHELVDQPVAQLIASRLQVKGGGHPTPRAVQQVIARYQRSWLVPGKPAPAKKSGRQPVYTERQKAEVARVGMSLKRQLIAPTPRKVRARLPRLARHPSTGVPMDKKTIHGIFKTRCYGGETRLEDTWVYQHSPCAGLLAGEAEAFTRGLRSAHPPQHAFQLMVFSRRH